MPEIPKGLIDMDYHNVFVPLYFIPYWHKKDPEIAKSFFLDQDIGHYVKYSERYTENHPIDDGNKKRINRLDEIVDQLNQYKTNQEYDYQTLIDLKEEIINLIDYGHSTSWKNNRENWHKNNL